MAAPRQIWHGEIVVDSSLDTIDLLGPSPSAATVTLTSGSYFLAKYSGESTLQLVEHMTSEIQSAGVDFLSVSVTYDSSTNKVSITDGAGAGNIVITWTDTALRDLLGFTGNVTVNGNTVTATNEPAYVWDPGRSLSRHLVDRSQWWSERSTGFVQQANDGTLVGIEAQIIYEQDVAYSYLAASRVVIPSTGSANIELQQFYADVIAKARKIRVYPDANNSTSLYYTLRIVGEDGEIPSLADMISPADPSYSVWNVSFSCRKEV